MSTVSSNANPKATSKAAAFFIAFMALSAAVLLAQSFAGAQRWHGFEFLGLVLAGAISSRLKVKLPGLNGNMSVNLPFIFIAMTQLNTAEALAVAAISVLVQSIPKAAGKFVPVQALFNCSTALVAAALGTYTVRLAAASQWNSALSLPAACAVHLLSTTMAVAVILALTDKRPALTTWSDLLHLSFPYYLASTGVASIAIGVGGHTSWPMLVGLVCVMFVTYRSFRLYFNSMRNQHPVEDTLSAPAKAAAAAQ